MSVHRNARLFLKSMALCAWTVFFMPSVATAQTSGTWTSASGGTWSNTANWSGNAVASGTGAAADFSTLNITGTQTVALDAAYTLGSLSFADTTTSSTGSWVISNGGTIGNTLTLNAGSGTTPRITVSGMGGGNATISARLLGSSGFILNDSSTPSPGTLVLSGSNAFTGNVTVNSGTLAFQNAGTNGFSYNGWTSGTLSLNAAGLSLATGVTTNFTRPIVLGAGTSTVVNQGTAINEFSSTGFISGPGSLFIGAGSNGLGFGLANTFSGGATLGAGSFVLLRQAGSGTPGAPTSGVFGTGTVTLDSTTIRPFSGGAATINNVVHVTGNPTFAYFSTENTVFTGPMTLLGGTRTFTTDGNAQITGSIVDGGSGLGLTKAGARLLVLGGSNTYSGATTLNSGTLRLDNQHAVLNSTFTHSGTGVLLFNSSVSANAFTFGGLAASNTAATLALSNTAGTAITLTVGGNNATTSYAGALAGAGSVVKVGSGILSLSGSNSYAGAMTVTGGVLSVSSANALPGWGTAGRVSVGAAGALAVGNDMTLQQASDAGYLDPAAGVGFNTAAGDRTVNDVIAGGRSFIKLGGNVLTLTGASTFTGPATLAGGTVALDVAQNGTSSGPLGASGTISFSGGGIRYSAVNQHDYSARFSTAAGQAYSVDTNGQDVAWAADLSSSGGSLAKSGAGRLTLSGSNSYTGITTVSAGTLAVTTAAALPGVTTAGRYSVASGATLATGASFDDATLQAMIATGNLAANTVFGVDTSSGNRTFANSLSGTLGLAITGGNKLSLSGSNTLGAVTVTAATLAVSSTSALLGAGGITLNGGQLESAMAGTTAYNFNGRSIVLSGSGGTLRNAGLGQLSWSSLSGTGALTFASGAGLLATGSNGHSGGTTIQPGAIVAYTADGGFGSGTLTIEGGSLRSTTTANRTVSNLTTLAGNPTFNSAGGGTDRDLVFTGSMTITGATRTVTVETSPVAGATGIFFNGPIGDGGSGFGLVKSGTGVLILGGANSYSGTTTLAAGTLRLDNADALAGGGNLSFTGGTLQYTSSNTADYAGRVRSSTAAIGVDTNGQNVTWNGAIDATNAGGLAKSGSGTLVLAADNAYSGTTTVSRGTLQIGAGGTTGSIAGNISLSNTAALVFSRSSNAAYGGSISGTGSFTKLGAGTLTLSGSNSYVGTTTVAGGTLVISSTSALPAAAFTLDGGTIVNTTGVASFGKSGSVQAIALGSGGGGIRSDVRMDMNGIISGASPTASMTYGTASGTASGVIFVIAGNSTYAGGTKVEAGVSILVDQNNAFGTGMLELAGAAIASRSSAPPRSIANGVLISANTTFNGAANSPNLTFTGTTTLSGGSRTLTVSSLVTSGTSAGQPGVIFTNTIGDGGNGYGITKAGVGVLALGGANTYTGQTVVTAGTIQLQNQAALQYSTLSLSGTGGVIFDSVVAGNAFSVGGLAASNAAATIALRNSASAAIALTVGGNNASTAYVGTLTGIGSLIKTGTGKLTLSGNNSYEGTTTVADGILAVNGNQSSATGGVSVAAAAALMGSGTIGGDTTIAGLHSPGNSPGIQTFIGDLAYSGGSSTVLWELGANTTSNSPLAYDQIVVGGDLDFAGLTTLSLSFNGAGSTVNWSDAFWNESRSWTLYSVAGMTTNFANLLLAGSPGSWLDTQSTPQSLASARPDATFSIAQDGDNVMVVYAVVPEPATIGAAGMGLVIAASLRAWRRQAARKPSGRRS